MEQNSTPGADANRTADAQAALNTAAAERIFAEKVSGAITDRKALAKALTAPGDALVVTRLDRLARSTRDLLNVLATICERGAGFMVTVLAGLAEFERALILARTGEGRMRAMARGVRFGRKPKLTEHQAAEAIARRRILSSATI
jgi:DNA invertase Pin-like site-specific DNA recombinase